MEAAACAFSNLCPACIRCRGLSRPAVRSRPGSCRPDAPGCRWPSGRVATTSTSPLLRISGLNQTAWGRVASPYKGGRPERGPGTSLPAPGTGGSGLGASRAAPEHPEDEEQDQGAEKRDDDRADKAHASMDEEAGDEAADKGADKADHEVADEPIAMTSADHGGGPTRNESDDDPRDDATRR